MTGIFLVLIIIIIIITTTTTTIIILIIYLFTYLFTPTIYWWCDAIDNTSGGLTYFILYYIMKNVFHGYGTLSQIKYYVTKILQRYFAL